MLNQDSKTDSYKLDIPPLLAIAVEAGKIIMAVYNEVREFEVVTKTDLSPLTIADKKSNDFICRELKKIHPAIPIISEEEKNISYNKRKDWSLYWCIDPLDGTKEFIKRNDEFTVNIALIKNQTPTLGVIYVPAKGILYYGSEWDGSWKQILGERAQQISALPKENNWIAAISRSHADKDEMALLNKYPISDTIAVGSSLKFCLLAEGRAQIYIRKGPTMEWDTAAGHAICLFAGCTINTLSKKPLLYNKESLLNEGFLCKIKSSHD